MKYLITESKLKQTLFKYYNSIFEDWYFVENGDWEGVSVPKYNGELLIGYKKDDPNTGYYWGDVIGIDFIESLFGLPNDEQKYFLNDYIKQKFGFDFMVLM
jgi:hypothetical protein